MSDEAPALDAALRITGGRLELDLKNGEIVATVVSEPVAWHGGGPTLVQTYASTTMSIRDAIRLVWRLDRGTYFPVNRQRFGWRTHVTDEARKALLAPGFFRGLIEALPNVEKERRRPGRR